MGTTISHDGSKTWDLFVGPGSAWASPFDASDGDPAAQQRAYERWLLFQTPLLDQLETLRGKRLGCNCEHPEHCHALIIARLAEEGAPQPADRMMSQGQRIALVRLFQRHVTGDRAARLWIITEYLFMAGHWKAGKTCTTFNQLTSDDWRFLRDRIWPAWGQNDWERIAPEFRKTIAGLRQRYTEEVLGQRRLL